MVAIWQRQQPFTTVRADDSDLGYRTAMDEVKHVPETGAIRFAIDGGLEVFDGTAWTSYEPPDDDGYGSILKGSVPESPPLHVDDQR